MTNIMKITITQPQLQKEYTLEDIRKSVLDFLNRNGDDFFNDSEVLTEGNLSIRVTPHGNFTFITNAVAYLLLVCTNEGCAEVEFSATTSGFKIIPRMDYKDVITTLNNTQIEVSE